MKYAELIEKCDECIRTFNPIISTIDSHADTYLVSVKDPYEKVFIKQIFYGCIRYQDFLKAFTKKFFERNVVGTNRNDLNLYLIFSYLSFFRLEELSMDDFKKLVLSQEPVKMHVFLQFLFDAEGLRQNVRESWMELYDYSYIDDKIIGGIEKNLPNVADILRNVERKATGKVTTSLSQSAASQSNLSDSQSQGTTEKQGPRASSLSGTPINGEIQQKKITEPQPFNLTKPKPKVIQQPIALGQEKHANPIPKNLFKKSYIDIEKEKEERRKLKTESIRKQYEENPKKRFELATEQRPTLERFESVKQELEKQFQTQINFNGVRPRQVPDFDKIEYQPIKLTAAAVKREALAIKKAEEIELKRLKDLEWNQRDETEFETWKREMDERDEVIRLDHIQRRKIEMELCREEAIIAQQKKAIENKQQAKNMKIESHKRLDEREKNLKEDYDKKLETVTQVHSQKDKAAESYQAMIQENRELRNQINKEITEALKRKREEEEHEHRKRQELIRQIRELEKIPIVRTKGFDPTEAGGHGLLEEMSIAELRERIEFQKRQIEQDTEKKRQDNLERKEKEQQDLQSTASMIEEAREKRRNENEQKRHLKKQQQEELEEKKRIIREKGLQEAMEKINKKKKEKQEEDERLAKELKQIRLQRQYMNQNVSVGNKALQDLEAGAERQRIASENEKLINKFKYNAIVVKDQTIRAENKKNEVMDKLEYDLDYKERLEVRKKENEMLHKKTLHA